MPVRDIATYMRAYRKNNPARMKVISQRRLDRGREVIRGAKNRPCADCNSTYPPYVMDFDHVRGVKEFTIGQHTNTSPAVLLHEIAKCDVVCANCHRERTHGVRA